MEIPTSYPLRGMIELSKNSLDAAAQECYNKLIEQCSKLGSANSSAEEYWTTAFTHVPAERVQGYVFSAEGTLKVYENETTRIVLAYGRPPAPIRQAFNNLFTKGPKIGIVPLKVL